jgi:hypothetical protein
VLQRTVPPSRPAAAAESLCFPYWLAWYSARRAASMHIERGSLCPENR